MYNTQSNTSQEGQGFSVGIEVDFVVWVVEINVISVWAIGVDLVAVQWSELTCFGVGGTHRLSFSVRTEIDLFFVRGSKQTLFLCACRKLFVFSVSMEVDLVFVTMVVELTWSRCGGSNSNWFQCRDEIDLVVVWVVEIDLWLVCWSRITSF